MVDGHTPITHWGYGQAPIGSIFLRESIGNLFNHATRAQGAGHEKHENEVEREQNSFHDERILL
jgi:hypothetical protein